MKVTIDGSTRLITTAQIGLVRKGGPKAARPQPIDWARDHIVILDARTGRAPAQCFPVEGAAEHAPPPADEASGQANPGGRLSIAQEEYLQTLWMASPNAAPDKIAGLFEAKFKRPISPGTANKYRPEPAGKR